MRKKRYEKYVFCVCIGVLFFLIAEISDKFDSSVENRVLFRNECGKGDALYEFYVDGLMDTVLMQIQVPEQKLTDEQFQECLPEMAELLYTRILGKNVSLDKVTSNLELVKEIPEYGVTVSWKSGTPEVVSANGTVFVDEECHWEEDGAKIFLEATLTNGSAEETLEIPVTVRLAEKSVEERFQKMLEGLVLTGLEDSQVILPDEFEGRKVKYRSLGHSQNILLLFLGFAAAVCLYLKEREDTEMAKKQREESLMADYPDLVSGFLILTGAGYSAKAAWKKMTEDYQFQKKEHPIYREMQITMNQMDTGTPETKAYADFGRRCGTRSYVKFASLLESSVSTGGRSLKKLLDSEIEEAFKLRSDIARRKGEEASSKLLFPMFGMLAVVMVLVAAPAFLSIG